MVSRFNTKCGTCKMHYQGFHICADLTTPEPKLKAPTRAGRMSPVEVHNLTLAQRERRERERLENARRDEEIIEWYAQGGIGYKDIQKKYGIGQSTTQKILKRGEAEGRLTIRRRGHTFAKGAL